MEVDSLIAQFAFSLVVVGHVSGKAIIFAVH